MGERLAGQLVGQVLDVVGTGPGIDHPGGAGFLLQEELGLTGNPGREVGRQAERLVEGVGVKRLGVTLGRGHRLDTGANHVVVSVLGGEAPAGGLAVGAKRKRLRVLRIELAHQLGPEQPPGPHLGDLHEEVHPDRPEEGKARRELVHVEPRLERGLHVLDPVGKGVAELEIGARPGLLHVVPGDRDRVEAGHLLRGVADDVGDDPHRRLGRVDVGVPHHELFEDVVLDRAGQLVMRHALFLASHDEQRKDRQHRPVHGHRDRHLLQRDPVEEGPHVVDAVDRHAGLADVTGNPGMIRVVAAVSREVEGDREALLAGRQIAAIESVRFLGGGVARVLADRPGLVHVHRRVRPTQIRSKAGLGVEEVEAFECGRGVSRFEGDSFRSLPVDLVPFGVTVAFEDRLELGVVGRTA